MKLILVQVDLIKWYSFVYVCDIVWYSPYSGCKLIKNWFAFQFFSFFLGDYNQDNWKWCDWVAPPPPPTPPHTQSMSDKALIVVIAFKFEDINRFNIMIWSGAMHLPNNYSPSLETYFYSFFMAIFINFLWYYTHKDNNGSPF